jgi:hypothetical protein
LPLPGAGSEIKGSKVKNLQNEEIGDIYEILVEPVAGQVRFAILSVGGFLGIGDTKVAIPWKAFEIIKEGDKPKWVLDATKERLQNAPICGKFSEATLARSPIVALSVREPLP